MKTKKILKLNLFVFLFSLFSYSQVKAFTAVTSGNWSSAATWGGVAPGGTVSAQDVTIPSGINVTLDMDVVFSGAINSFTVDGTLTGSSTYMLTIAQGAFAGSGTVNIHSIAFTNILSSMTYTGTLAVDEFKNMGASLVLGAVISVQDTLNLESGTMVLNSGSNLTVLTNSTVKVKDGSLAMGGGIFNSSSNYAVVYIGSSKTTGVELNTTTLQDLYVNLTDNTQTLTLGGNLIINGDLYYTRGRFNFGAKSLTLHGDAIGGPGAMLNSNASSNLTLQGATPPVQPLMFVSGATMNNLTIDYSGSGTTRLGSDLGIAGYLQLNDGDFSVESGSTLTMSAGSTIHQENGALMLAGGNFDGTASYNIEYMGSSYTTGVEMSGSGLNNVMVNLLNSSHVLALGSDYAINGNFNLVSGQLNLNGNKLTLNGLFTQIATAKINAIAGSELELNMASTSNDTLYFSSTYNSLDKFTINVSGSGNVVLGSNLIIVNELILTSGGFNLYNSNLTIGSAATISGYNDTRYILTSGSGTLVMHVNASGPYVTFPVGTTSGYSPAYLQQSASGTSGNFMVRAMNGVYTNGTVGFNSATTESLVDRTWLISEDAGVTVNANIKLGWKPAAEVNGFDRTNAYISHYDAGSWDAMTPSAAASGAFSTYEISRASLTTLSPFSVADNNAVLSVEEKELANELHLFPNPAHDYLFLESSNLTNNFKYELVDLTGKVIMNLSNKNNRQVFDVSKLNNGYYFIRATNLDNNETVTKRFIKG